MNMLINKDKIEILIGFLYTKYIFNSILDSNDINDETKRNIKIYLSQIKDINLTDLSNRNYNNIKDYLSEMKGYSFLKLAQSNYLKISQKHLFEYVGEGFFYEYVPNEINKGVEINKDIIYKTCDNEMKKYPNNSNKMKNLQERKTILKNTSLDKFHGLFFTADSDLFSYIAYGTQITVGINDYLINNHITQYSHISNSFEFNFNEIYIAKNFDLCDKNILASLIKTIESINKFQSGFYDYGMKRLKQNLLLYNNSKAAIDLLDKLPDIINKCANKKELIDTLDKLYPKSQDYDYIFNSNEFIDRYRKELGIEETVTESQYKLIPSEFLEYISTSKDEEVQEFYKDFCEYFKIPYEPLIEYPIKYAETIYIEKDIISNKIKKSLNSIFNKLNLQNYIPNKIKNLELEINYCIDISQYSIEQLNKIKELDNMNQNNPQNAFNILTILHPDFSPHLMDKIAELEKYKKYSSIPIRNPKLSNEQIDILCNLIQNNEDVWHIKTSNVKIENIIKLKEIKSIKIESIKEELTENIEYDLNRRQNIKSYNEEIR